MSDRKTVNRDEIDHVADSYHAAYRWFQDLVEKKHVTPEDVARAKSFAFGACCEAHNWESRIIEESP